jgi:hypothetical protein
MTMNDQLEAELRALRATEVPTDAVERLRRVDYRPRTRRRWPLTVSALGATSGTAAIVSVVVLGGSQTAFAGWSATPTTPTDAQSATTQDNCQANLATMPGGADQGSWSQVATDVRGPYTVVIYQAGSSFATCFTGPSFTVASINSTNGRIMTASGSSSGPGGGLGSGLGAGAPGGGSTSTGVSSPGGGIEQLVVSHLSLPGNGPYTLAEGSLDSTVSAVTLVLSDGQDVTATTVNGWFVAWWPNSQDATSAQITSATGTTTEPLNNPPIQTPSSPPTSGPGSGAASVSGGTGATQSGSDGGAVNGPSTNAECVNGGGGAAGPSIGQGGLGESSGALPPPPTCVGANS